MVKEPICYGAFLQYISTLSLLPVEEQSVIIVVHYFHPFNFSHLFYVKLESKSILVKNLDLIQKLHLVSQIFIAYWTSTEHMKGLSKLCRPRYESRGVRV